MAMTKQERIRAVREKSDQEAEVRRQARVQAMSNVDEEEEDFLIAMPPPQPDITELDPNAKFGEGFLPTCGLCCGWFKPIDDNGVPFRKDNHGWKYNHEYGWICPACQKRGRKLK